MSAPLHAFDPAELCAMPVETLARYDVAGPRYTSYPTAPVWTDAYGPARYAEALARGAASGRPLSIYVHLPFCESLCIYCGCNVIITKRHDRAEGYVRRVMREIDMTAEAAGAARRRTIQVAWGGGTPTFLSPEQIERLMGHIAARFPLAADAEVGIEVDPRVTTRDHVRSIVRSGFNRISMGVQDFDPDVQKTIHRVQPFEMTKALVDACREEGLRSVNVDLVYGLPKQTLAKFESTIDRVLEIAPERVSAFSYAHVPWLKPQQKHFRDEDLPRGAAKFAIFARLLGRLAAAGWDFIGMDHFARPDNELAVAQRTGGLWRNFQGFTTKAGADLVGVGVTSIGSVAGTFAQNAKDEEDWGASVDRGEFPVRKGHVLTRDDEIRAAAIQDVMCRYRMDWDEFGRAHGIDARTYFASAAPQVARFAEDGLVAANGDGFALTSRGRFFVRNVCMAFDAHLAPAEKPVFSRTL
ncbi:MAG: Oxygen-independent coproporphyrinogen III oxidase [Planctomycetes bacterium]|nr:Oxygen-independent coproporphyrinogen III oxidase [Planctomycetota bacterium]